MSCHFVQGVKREGLDGLNAAPCDWGASDWWLCAKDGAPPAYLDVSSAQVGSRNRLWAAAHLSKVPVPKQVNWVG